MNVKEMVDNYIKEKNNSGKVRVPLKDNEFYASSAGGCPRAMYFEKVIGGKEFDTDTQRIFLVGNLMHDFLQQKVFKSGESEQSLTVDENGIKIFGRLDHIDGDVVYEFKSTNSLKNVMNEPNDHHKKQLMIYLKALGKKQGKIVYVEKNTFDIVEHDVVYNEQAFNRVLKEFMLVSYAVQDRVPPVFKDDWRCRYCNWRKECKEALKDG